MYGTISFFSLGGGNMIRGTIWKEMSEIHLTKVDLMIICACSRDGCPLCWAISCFPLR